MVNRVNDRDGQLQRALDNIITQNPSIRSSVLRVEAPDFKWEGAAGFADPDQRIAMTPDVPFRSASVGKMILAAALLTFVEDGTIRLDKPAVEYLHGRWPQGFDTAITVRQLINHTSGIADYFGDGEPISGQPPFVIEMMQAPDKLWDPQEIVDWTARHIPSRFSPGAGWHYSDTGFLLAGLIVEAAAKAPLHAAYRQRLFEPLDMRQTYMVFREPSPLPGMQESNAYAGDLLYTAPRTMSADWAGGGLVTTAQDLTHFIRAMADNRVFQDSQTRDTMFSWTATGEPGVYYGLGVRRFVLPEVGVAHPGEIWGHTGALNVSMFYYPHRDVTITGTLNQASVPGVWSQVRPVPVIVPQVLTILG